MSGTGASLNSLIESKAAYIGIVGLGYVGMPLAMAAAASGFRILGFDINSARVDQINRGESVIESISNELLSDALNGDRFSATAEFSRLSEPDVIIIAVPTPLSRHREPDLSFVINSTREIANHLRKGQLIVLESTSYPGTTRLVMKPILEASGLVSGRDFYLGFSPEREDPGNEQFNTRSIPKVVAGDDDMALTLVDALYSRIVMRTVRVSTLDTAEAVKLTENIFRAVNIALVNELKQIYSAMGIDIWEVIEAAKTKPFGFMPFYPGPGLGGHCIPIDPFYLTWKAREYGISTRFIELAGEINVGMPRYVLAKLAEAMDARFGDGLKGARILIVGMAYKKNVADTRESASLVLAELIEARGGIVDYHDPFVPVIPQTREHPSLMGRRSIALTPSAIAQYDATLIATDHDAIDYAVLASESRLIIDTRNACRRRGIAEEHVINA